MGGRMKKTPENCKGHYIPWVCGLCMLKKECKPRELARFDRNIR